MKTLRRLLPLLALLAVLALLAALALRDARRARALSGQPLDAKYRPVAATAVPHRPDLATWLRMLKRYGG